MKVLIQIKRNRLVFSILKKSINEENLNNTNVINAEKLIFDDQYMIDNQELLTSFLKTVIIKNNIDSIEIKDVSISNITLAVIFDISYIEKVYFTYNELVTYNEASLLIENNNIKYVNCYSMPQLLFDRLNQIKNINIELRLETLYIEKLMEDNKIVNYADIYYKKDLDIKFLLDNQNLDSLEMFLMINNRLKVINLYEYSVEQVESLLKLLIKTNKRKIRINIYQKKEETKTIITILSLIKRKYMKFIKESGNTVKVVYSHSYIKSNGIKQVNWSLIMECIVLTIVFIIFVIFFGNLKR